MLYLSQLLQRQLYFQEKPYAKIIDFGISDAQKSPIISTILVKVGKEKHVLSAKDVSLHNNNFSINTEKIDFLAYNSKDFYLEEDLLDKQVIDITGKRLVRVNDVIIKQNGKLSIAGIDVSFAGILRRLGIKNSNLFKTVMIPWSFIGAFDYQTGDVHIRLGSSAFNNLHPSEIAEILEDAGAKERLGVIDSLDTEKAADVLEETDTEVQQSILEELSPSQLKNIVQKMSLAELADALPHVSEDTKEEIFSYLGEKKTKMIHALFRFAHDTAGGLMEINVPTITSEHTIENARELFISSKQKEGILVIDENAKVKGVIDLKDMLKNPSNTLVGEIMQTTSGVAPETSFDKLLRLFAEYNLRLLPVVSKNQEILGVVSIDNILEHLYEVEEDETA